MAIRNRLLYPRIIQWKVLFDWFGWTFVFHLISLIIHTWIPIHLLISIRNQGWLIQRRSLIINLFWRLWSTMKINWQMIFQKLFFPFFVKVLHKPTISVKTWVFTLKRIQFYFLRFHFFFKQLNYGLSLLQLNLKFTKFSHW